MIPSVTTTNNGTTKGSVVAKSDSYLREHHPGEGDSGTTTRPASWPKDPPNNPENNNIEMMIAQNASSDRPVLLNVGGKKFEVSTYKHHLFSTYTENFEKLLSNF